MVFDGKLEDLLSRHRVLIGPGIVADAETAWLPPTGVIEIRRSPRQTIVLLDQPVPDRPVGWTDSDPTLDELVVAYLWAGRPKIPATGPGRTSELREKP